VAGDWIAIRVDLHSVPEVLRSARLLGRPVDEVVGLLVRFWAWAQTHTDEGYLPGVELEDIAAGSHVPTRFLSALVEVGWLICDPGKGVWLPNFGRWNSHSAHRRLKERDKKRRQRKCKEGNEERPMNKDPPENKNMSRSCPDRVPILSRCDRDNNGTTEQNSTVYPPNPPSPSSTGGCKGSAAATASFVLGPAEIRANALAICRRLWPAGSPVAREGLKKAQDQRLVYRLAVLWANDFHQAWLDRLLADCESVRPQKPLAWLQSQAGLYAPEGVEISRLLRQIDVPQWAMADPRDWPK